VERIDGRTAFVTGAASGIGLAITEALIADGARVVMADQDAISLERECPRFGRLALAQRLDVTDRSSWQEAKRSTENTFGPVEILVNNAGVAPDYTDLADMSAEHFDRMVAVSLTGVFNGISTFGATMRTLGEGHIVNTSSIVGLLGPARRGAYVAAKSGVVGLSEVLRAEMEPYRIGVSVLCPGRVRTNLFSQNQPAHRTADDGIDPHLVAMQVVGAIRKNELYVITHRELKRLVAERMGRLLEAFDRAPAH
jgi:NAD(P)-dependent dehydrogenase (short-subunit alcohol dehydrogenase family)